MPKRWNMGLFPWILGGLVAAAGTSAAGTSGVDTPMAGPASTQPAAANAASPAMPAQRPAPPTAATSLATSKPSATPPAGSQAPPPGTVWECVANGERIFSDTRCGATAMIRPLSETNRMEATAVYPAYYYQSAYPSYYPDDDAAGADPVDSGSPVYVFRNGLLIDKRRQHGHPEPAHLPAHGPPAAHAPPPGHGSPPAHGSPKKS